MILLDYTPLLFCIQFTMFCFGFVLGYSTAFAYFTLSKQTYCFQKDDDNTEFLKALKFVVKAIIVVIVLATRISSNSTILWAIAFLLK